MYHTEDLMAVRYSRESTLEKFLNSWDAVLTGMNDEPPPEFLDTLFMTQIKQSAVEKMNVTNASYSTQRSGSKNFHERFLGKMQKIDL